MDTNTVAVLVILFWLAIGLMAVGFVFDGFRKTLAGDGPLPFFRKLEQRGLTAERLEAQLGMQRLAGAIRRCALCRDRRQCERGEAVDCPNEDILRG